MPAQPFDKTQGKPIDSTQGKPATGIPPANNLPQNPPIPPGEKRLIDFIKIPAEQPFSGISQILFLASVVVVIGICLFFLGIPRLQKGISTGRQTDKVGSFVPPINVADINFPSERQQDVFLKNFQDAGKTNDYQERYKLLQNDYTQLREFYTGDHDPKTRKVLEQYAQYMISNYPEHAQESIYTVPCFDSGCGKPNYPQEVLSIKDGLGSITSLDQQVLKDINFDFDAAALSSDVGMQWNSYFSALQQLISEKNRTKDVAIGQKAGELLEFMKNKYPDNFQFYEKNMPDFLKI